MSKQLDTFDYGYCYHIILVKMSKYCISSEVSWLDALDPCTSYQKYPL